MILNFLALVGGGAFILFSVWLVVRIFNKEAAMSWLHLGRTKVGQAGDYALSIDPAGQMRQAAIDAANDLRGADKALEAAQKLNASLTRQIENDSSTAIRLRGQVADLLRKGNSETDAGVVEKLRRIRDLEKSVEDNKAQLAMNQDNYDRLLKQANSAARKIDSAKAEAERMKVRLDLGAQQEHLAGLVSSYSGSALNDKMADLDKYRQAANSKLDGYTARQRVLVDRGLLNQEEDEPTPETDPALNDILTSIKAKVDPAVNGVPAAATK